MEPTPIEDPETRKRMEELRRHSIEGSYDEILQQIGARSIGEEKWQLLQAKMAHDRAMRGAVWSLERQEHDRRFITRIVWWFFGSLTAVLLFIATQCTGEYGGTVLDDPDHYSRRH